MATIKPLINGQIKSRLFLWYFGKMTFFSSTLQHRMFPLKRIMDNITRMLTWCSALWDVMSRLDKLSALLLDANKMAKTLQCFCESMQVGITGLRSKLDTALCVCVFLISSDQIKNLLWMKNAFFMHRVQFVQACVHTWKHTHTHTRFSSCWS